MLLERTPEQERRIRLLQAIEMHAQGKEMSNNQEQIIDEICTLLPIVSHHANPLQDVTDDLTRAAIKTKFTRWMVDERPNECRSHVVTRLLGNKYEWPQ